MIHVLNHSQIIYGIYFDENGNEMDLKDIKIIINDEYIRLNNIELKMTNVTNNCMNKMNERLKLCMNNIIGLKLDTKNNENGIRNHMLGRVDLCDGIMNE